MTTLSDDIYREGDWVRMPAYRWKQIEKEMISRRAMELISASEKEIDRLHEENKVFRNAQKACEHCDAPTVDEVKRLRGLLREAIGPWEPDFRKRVREALSND